MSETQAPLKTRQVRCRDCERRIHPPDLNPAKGLAKCKQCDEVFFYAGPYAGLEEPERLPIPIPAGYDIRLDSEQMLISWRWGGFWSLFWLIVAGIVNGPITVYSIYILYKMMQDTPIVTLFNIAWLVAWLISAGYSGYMGLAMAFNRTLIRVSADGLSKTCQPFPYPGSRFVLPVMIKQLYVKERAVRRRYSHSGHSHVYIELYYDLMLRLKDGDEVALITMDTPEQAEFLEVEIEKFLAIADKPVEGETAKRLF